MARPVFIVCAQSTAEDKDTGLFSLFELVEKLIISPIPTPKEGDKTVLVRWNPFRLVAVWLLEPDKGETYEDEFEYDLRLYLPLSEQPISLASGIFKFSQPVPRLMHRFTLRFDSPPPLDKSGVMRAESKIRKLGSEVWLSQDYPVVVEVMQPTRAD